MPLVIEYICIPIMGLFLDYIHIKSPIKVIASPFNPPFSLARLQACQRSSPGIRRDLSHKRRKERKGQDKEGTGRKSEN